MITEFTANNLPDFVLSIPNRQVFVRVMASAIINPAPSGNGVIVKDFQRDKGDYLTAAHKLQINQVIDDGKGGMILRCTVTR